MNAVTIGAVGAIPAGDSDGDWYQGCQYVWSRSVQGSSQLPPSTAAQPASGSQPVTTTAPSQAPSGALPATTIPQAAPADLPTTTTTTLTGAQEAFANDIGAKIPGITQDGSPATPSELAQGGQIVCYQASQTNPNGYGAWTVIVDRSTNGALVVPDGPENAGPATFASIAITDLCPSYAGLIPTGTPT